MTQNTTSHKNTIPSDIEIAVNEGYRLGAYITNDGYAFAFVSAVTKKETRNVINPIERTTSEEMIEISFTPIDVRQEPLCFLQFSLVFLVSLF